MEIKNRYDGKQGVFYIEDAGKEIGLMHYTLAGPAKMVVDHTEVGEGFEGRGFGRQLVKAGVTYAREHQLKIVPRCEFAKKMFDITPAFADVLF